MVVEQSWYWEYNALENYGQAVVLLSASLPRTLQGSLRYLLTRVTTVEAFEARDIKSSIAFLNIADVIGCWRSVDFEQAEKIMFSYFFYFARLQIAESKIFYTYSN